MTTTFPHKDFNKAFQLHSKGRVVRSISIDPYFSIARDTICNKRKKCPKDTLDSIPSLDETPIQTG